jgi:RNA polymerase sporulation-specific sigma factor
LTAEEVLKRYEPFIKRKASDYAYYAESHFDKHLYAFSYDDIKQVSSIGAIKAYENYDISQDVIFYTYLHPMVIGELRRYFRDVPLLRRQGPSAYDFKYTSIDSTFDAKGNGDKEVSIAEKIADENNNIDDFIDKEYIKELLNQVKGKMAQVIQLYFFECKTQTEIGDILEISQVQVSRLISKALNILREYIKRNEEKTMATNNVKDKPSPQAIIAYLDFKADMNVSITSMIKKLAETSGVSASTLFASVRNHPEYEKIKKLYKNTSYLEESNQKSEQGKNISMNVKEETLKKEEPKYAELTNNSVILPKEVKNAVSINTLKAVDVDNSEEVNILKDINIKSMSIELSKNIDALYSENGVRLLIENNKYMNREDLVNFKNNIEKAIQVYDFIIK